MKTKSLSGFTLSLALPVILLLAGCNQKNESSTESSNPASNTNGATADVDNSRNNVRDRNNATLTPGDQGNSPADRDTTQKIRQALVSGTNDFSMVAKNVKIITTDGKVTLRGPVNNEGEKTGIEAIAQNVAGAGNVNDQLEVKANQ